MKAIVAQKYGPPEILQIKEVEKPVPKDNEVLVKVYATSVNRSDCGILRAKPFFMRFMTGLFKPKKQIPGTEFAGSIEAVGSNVSSFKNGDRVFGFNDVGLQSHAQYLTIAEDGPLATIPKKISFEQAAAGSEGVHYAKNFINKVDIEKGKKVFVNGATGAIGSAAVQLLKHYGATVTATCGTKNIDLVKSLGADRIIDYQTEDFTKDEEQYHYVFDAVGKSTFGKCKPLLLPGGIYLASDLGPWAQNMFLPTLTKIYGKKKMRFPFPTDLQGSVLLMKELMEKGKFTSVIDGKYPLEEIVEAFTYVETGKKVGNVVITVKH